MPRKNGSLTIWKITYEESDSDEEKTLTVLARSAKEAGEVFRSIFGADSRSASIIDISET